MRSLILASSILGLVSAAPAPQDIDFDLAYSLPDVTYSEVVGATAQVVSYNPTTVLAAAKSQITASETDLAAAVITSTADSSTLEKRAACAAQASGYGPVPQPDSASNFRAYPSFAASAAAAPVPSGYTQVYSNRNGSSNAYGYMGYTTLKTYDSNACAAKCNAINGCISFNVYFERDPSVEPASGCPNPASTTNIKCVFWGGPISSDDAVNTGQYRSQFEVAIAGSNGYVNDTIASVPGYNPAVYLGNAAISAPYDIYGYSSYLGNAIFIGSFNAQLCAQACTEKSDYARRHPPTDGTPIQTCQFFNTYILYINTTSQMQGQYCAMYAESWDKSYATNVGQYRGNDHFLIEYSFSYTNSSNPGSPNPLAAVYQAKSEILRPSNTAAGASYCSSILGYSTPVATATATATVAPFATTTITNVDVATQTATVYSEAAVFVTTTIVVYASPNGKRAEPTGELTVLKNGVTALALPELPTGIAKRAASTPAFLTKYPGSIVSSACSLVATPVQSTSTVTNTVTQTFPTSYTTSTVLSTSYVTVTDVEVATTTVLQPVTTVVQACTTPAYKLQIGGSIYEGDFIAADTPSPDRYTYTFVTAKSGNDANAWRLHANGNVYAADNSAGWTAQYGTLYYVLEISDFANSNYGLPRPVCAVSGGKLSCVRSDNGASLSLGFCPNETGNNLLSWDTASGSQFSDCTAITINAIAAGTVC